MLELKDYAIKLKKKFSLESTFSEVVSFLIEANLTHIPIIENGIFVGNLSLNDAETFEPEAKVVSCSTLLEVFFAKESSFWFEVLEIYSKHHCNMIPVLDKKNNCIGYYYFDDIIHLFNETPFLKEAGTTIIIEKDSFNYSFSQISQIFEVNNAKILGILISKISEQKVQLIIKATSINVNEIIQTLRRYEYEIISEHFEDQFLSDLKERSNYLDKYLNI